MSLDDAKREYQDRILHNFFTLFPHKRNRLRAPQSHSSFMMVTSADDDGRVAPPHLHRLAGAPGRQPLYDAMRAMAAVLTIRSMRKGNNSQADERTSTDWRAGPCQYEDFSLPEQVEAAIHRLMNSFDINFASLDMIVTPEGEFVFLELNPNGQWLWIEFELGLPLLKSFVNLLTSAIR